MSEEKRVTETKTKTKNDLFGDPKETKTTSNETKVDSSGNKQETKTEYKEKKGRPTSGRPPLCPYFCGFGGSGFGCGFGVGCGFGGSGFGCSVANVDVLIAISPFALLRISMR